MGLELLTRAGVQRFGSDDERRADRVERQFLEVITRLSGQNLVDHESLVAPPGSLQLPGGGEPELGLAVHGVPLRRVSTSVCEDVSAQEPDVSVLLKMKHDPSERSRRRQKAVRVSGGGRVDSEWSCAPRRVGDGLKERRRKAAAI